MGVVVWVYEIVFIKIKRTRIARIRTDLVLWIWKSVMPQK